MKRSKSIARERVYLALQLMASRGDVIRDTHGNVSFRENDFIYIKPSGVPYDQISRENVCKVSVKTGKSAKSSSDLQPSVDTEHHLSIYRYFPWIDAICHTHSPYATSFAIAQRVIWCYSTEHADYFGRPVRCLKYSGPEEWGKDVVSNLRPDERAILLGNHGTLTFADDPVKAVERSLALENIATKAHLARQLDDLQGREIPPSEISKWYVRYNWGGYGQ